MKNIFLYLLTLTLFLTFSISIDAQKPTESTREAVQLMIKGDVKGAIAVLDKAIAKEKDLFESYRMRAFLRQRIGDFEGMIADLTKALEIKPDAAELYTERAMTRLTLRQDFSLILKDLDSAISYGKKAEKVYSLRAMVRQRAGDREGAIDDYQAAIGLRPDLAQAYVGLASIYSMNGEMEKAALILENFISSYEGSNNKAKVKGEVIATDTIILPNRNEGQTTQTIITKDSNGSKMSSEEANEKLEQSKNVAYAYASLASIYVKQKQYEKASPLIDKAHKIDPTDILTLETRGRLKLGLGDFQGAVNDFDMSIKMIPVVTSVYLERGVAYFMLGNEDAAQKDFDKYIQAFPNLRANYEKRLEEAKELRLKSNQ
jgi:tetratricopeptide (TPR) repeat protein